MDNSNIQREELTCSQTTSLRRFFVRNKNTKKIKHRSSTTDRVAAGGNCFLNCSDSTKVESWVEPVECGVDGEWSISQLPLKCIATCQEDVITKGLYHDPYKNIIGSANNPTVELLTKEEVLEQHCTSLQVEDRKLFVEGKTKMSPHYLMSDKMWS